MILFNSLLIVFVLGGLIFGYIKYIEKNSVFFPIKEIEKYPSDWGLEFDNVYFYTSDNVKINGWFIGKPDAESTFLYLHGNGGNISHRIEKASIFHELGVNIFMIDYRGYGQSRGSPSESGVYKDAVAAYKYLTNQKNIKSEDIIIFGESLGSAVAIDLASRKPVAAIVLEGAFSSVKDISKSLYPVLPSFMFSNMFDSLSKIDNVEFPKLFIHSKNDEIIPYKLARKLYRKASPPKEFLDITGGHNTAFIDSKPKFRNGIKMFVESLKGKQ